LSAPTLGEVCPGELGRNQRGFIEVTAVEIDMGDAERAPSVVLALSASEHRQGSLNVRGER
jgi:hypothetical protein